MSRCRPGPAKVTGLHYFGLHYLALREEYRCICHTYTLSMLPTYLPTYLTAYNGRST